MVQYKSVRAVKMVMVQYKSVRAVKMVMVYIQVSQSCGDGDGSHTSQSELWRW